MVVENLDDDEETVNGLEEYVYKRLVSRGQQSPYYGREDAAAEVGKVIADRADRNFLFARVVARSLQRRAPVMTQRRGWQQSLASDLTQAFNQDIEDSDDPERIRDLLMPLAWCEGVGIPAREVWPTMATALSSSRRTYTPDDINWLLLSAGRYIVESGEDGQAVYRLFHQYFTDYFRANARLSAAAIQAKISSSLRTLVSPGPLGWRGANPYLRRHLAMHAAMGGDLGVLIRDRDFLATAEPRELHRACAFLRDKYAIRIATLYRRAAPYLTGLSINERAALLHMAAHQQDPGLREKLRPNMATPWTTVWCEWKSADYRVRLDPHEGRITGLTAHKAGHDVTAVSVGGDGFLNYFDVNTGAILDTLEVSNVSLIGSAVGGSHDRPQLAIADSDDIVHILDLESGEFRYHVPTQHGRLRGLATGTLGEASILVTGGADKTARIWDLDTGTFLGELRLDAGIVTLALGRLNGITYLASAGEDRVVTVCELLPGEQRSLESHGNDVILVPDAPMVDDDDERWDSDGEESSEPWYRHHLYNDFDRQPGSNSWNYDDVDTSRDRSRSLRRSIEWSSDAIEDLSNMSIFDDRELQSHRSEDGAIAGPIHELETPDAWQSALAFTTFANREFLISGGCDGTLRMWEHTKGTWKAVSKALTDSSVIEGIQVLAVKGRQVIATVGEYSETNIGLVELWRPPLLQPISKLAGHTAPATALCKAVVDHMPTLVTGDSSGSVLIWDLLGAGAADIDVDDTPEITCITTGRLFERDVVAIADYSGVVTFRRLDNGTLYHKFSFPMWREIRQLIMGRVFDQDAVWSISHDASVECWSRRKEGGWELVYKWVAPGYYRAALAFREVGRRPVVAWVGGGPGILIQDGDRRIHWTIQPPPGLSQPSHKLTAVAIAETSGRLLLATGGENQPITVYDAATHKVLHTLGRSSLYLDLHFGTLEGRSVLVSYSADGYIRVWDLWGGREMYSIQDQHRSLRSMTTGVLRGTQVLASTGDNGVVQLYHSAASLGRRSPFITRLNLGEPLIDVAIVPDGRIVAAGPDGVIVTRLSVGLEC